ncbi:hypothetical protein LTR62_000129 [Meristemomyces frigidus]|uniref:Autophagy-related protein 16 domain-containing protein n=1 Tax=Meristemomyces frigidus TaxID=1508187 RepID=A0AAN7YSW8_9PEZI|nr:hypothetical protein LTR62_000129 [Meristemomyces frigidus]
MSDWIEQYSAALIKRDVREQAHKSYIDAYTQLADRTASQAQQSPAIALPTSPQPSSNHGRSSTPVKSKSTDADQTAGADTLVQLRHDLSTTQKARVALQTQLEDLTTTLKALQANAKTSTTQLALLTRQKLDLERKLRDREEEVRVKTKMATDATDEMVALELQLNLADAKSKRLMGENHELVDRWMKRIGEEAESMNRDSKWE